MSSLQPKGLLEVPLEIRLVIYDRVLSTHSVATISDPIEPVFVDRHDGGRVGKAITDAGLNLLCVCKQIHDEASKIFYDKIKFSFHRGHPTDLDDAFKVFETFLATARRDTISKVKHFKLQPSQCPETEFESWDELALRRYGARMRESEALFSKLETIEIWAASSNCPLFDNDQLEVFELARELFHWHPKLTQVVRLDDEASGLPPLTMRIVTEGQKVTSADPQLNVCN